MPCIVTPVTLEASLVLRIYIRENVEMRDHLETQAAWTRAPVATKSRLSLCPQVNADTGH